MPKSYRFLGDEAVPYEFAYSPTPSTTTLSSVESHFFLALSQTLHQLRLQDLFGVQNIETFDPYYGLEITVNRSNTMVHAPDKLDKDKVEACWIFSDRFERDRDHKTLDSELSNETNKGEKLGAFDAKPKGVESCSQTARNNFRCDPESGDGSGNSDLKKVCVKAYCDQIISKHRSLAMIARSENSKTWNYHADSGEDSGSADRKKQCFKSLCDLSITRHRIATQLTTGLTTPHLVLHAAWPSSNAYHASSLKGSRDPRNAFTIVASLQGARPQSQWAQGLYRVERLHCAAIMDSWIKSIGPFLFLTHALAATSANDGNIRSSSTSTVHETLTFTSRATPSLSTPAGPMSPSTGSWNGITNATNTSVQPNITPAPQCGARCELDPYEPSVLIGGWDGNVFNTTVEAFTEFVYINNRTNTTRTSTVTNEEVIRDFPLPTETNANGTRTTQLTHELPHLGITTTIELAYPTTTDLIADYFKWNGTLSTSGSCVTYESRHTQYYKSSVSVPAGPFLSDTDDPRGWYHTWQPEAIQPFRFESFAAIYLDELALHECPYGPASASSPGQTFEVASFATITSTVPEINPPTSSTMPAPPSTPKRPPLQTDTSSSGPIPAISSSQSSTPPAPTELAPAQAVEETDLDAQSHMSTRVIKPPSQQPSSFPPPAPMEAIQETSLDSQTHMSTRVIEPTSQEPSFLPPPPPIDSVSGPVPSQAGIQPPRQSSNPASVLVATQSQSQPQPQAHNPAPVSETSQVGSRPVAQSSIEAAPVPTNLAPISNPGPGTSAPAAMPVTIGSSTINLQPAVQQNAPQAAATPGSTTSAQTQGLIANVVASAIAAPFFPAGSSSNAPESNAGSASQHAFVLGSQTLTPGGSALTVAGTSVSMPANANNIVVGSSTRALPSVAAVAASQGNAAVSSGVVLGASTDDTGSTIDGATFLPGASAVAMGASSLSDFTTEHAANLDTGGSTMPVNYFTPQDASNPTTYAVFGSRTVAVGARTTQTETSPPRTGAEGATASVAAASGATLSSETDDDEGESTVASTDDGVSSTRAPNPSSVTLGGGSAASATASASNIVSNGAGRLPADVGLLIKVLAVMAVGLMI
ncbi:MAG: hypothetical protein Q9159_003244 [Coniocarpon cinnabarinum]